MTTNPATNDEPDLASDFYDPILAEVYETKVKLLERYNGDVGAMIRDARARQAQSGHPIVTAPLDKVDPTPIWN